MEAQSFSAFIRVEELFGKAVIRRFMQVLGSALARAAEAAVSVSIVNLTGPIIQRGGSALEMAEARAIGFIDIVGFTPLARQVEPRELARIIDRFEETAHDVATACGGRIVKFVGDEVMFVSDDAAAACEIALTLVERFAGDDSVTPRGAVAAGEVMIRGGDYYGPTVNLAARLAQLAVPAEILVTEPVVATASAAGLCCEPAGRRVLKGFDAPVRVLAVGRSTG